MTWLTSLYQYRYPIIGAVIFLSLSTIGWYVYYLQKKNSSLSKQLILLEQEISLHNSKISNLYTCVEDIQKARESIVYTLRQQDKDYKEFKDTLYRDVYKNKKSLEELSKKKTKLVEKAINKATSKVIEDLENVTK